MFVEMKPCFDRISFTLRHKEESASGVLLELLDLAIAKHKENVEFQCEFGHHFANTEEDWAALRSKQAELIECRNALKALPLRCSECEGKGWFYACDEEGVKARCGCTYHPELD
jgi:hypothetical protein